MMINIEHMLKDIHAEKFETTDKGFGRLFATVFKDKHRYNPSRKDFMRYDGKRWVDDIEGLSAKASAKFLSDSLIKYAAGIDAEYLKAVTALCNIRNRNNMLQDSKDVYFFNNEQLDMYLADKEKLKETANEMKEKWTDSYIEQYCRDNNPDINY